MKVIDLMEDFLQWLEAEKGYAQSTLKAYKYDILLFLRWYKEYYNENNKKKIVLQDIDLKDLRNFIIYLAQELEHSNTTRCRKIACLKSFWHYLSNIRKLADNITSDLSLPKKEPTPEIYLRQIEINKLFNVIKEISRNNIRDKCILAVLLYTGIRVSECVDLNLSDINLEDKTLRVVKGKGGKSRMIGINKELLPYLHKYLKQRKQINIEDNPLFVSERDNRLSKRTLQYHFKRWVQEAGLSNEITVHKCRHTFLSHLCQNGATLAEIKQISGHKNLASLQRYLHNDQKRLNEIVNKVSYNN
ncbi:tyrosine-type recombinase/integrase [Selenihalanaerobacter shriftii]|uniref:Site-specific recombinase XerD n=1 Tax=Selenihalanaerobacter shriftii TaxID=142842 RepID=A0A1T4Q8Q7_9FIRM|nr:tyrosine-type recombinase/integrase [Selenihalanaerobacter shriftii]SKA00104.1 Site-specific recombinase XerD [Selenihalanaerobacter shriftii]